MTCQLYLGGDFINKRQFITQTLTFISNSIFINIFAKIFGMSNSIVAVSLVVIALSLLIIDLRKNILKRTIYISVFMLTIGLCATISNINPIIGLILDFSIIFFIVYEGTNTYKENLYFPFLLAYIFMKMSAPASIDNLPIRIMGIISGSGYILLVQLVLNGNRFKKTISSGTKGIINMTLNRIDSFIEGKKSDFSKEKLYSLNECILKSIYDNKSGTITISEENRELINFVLGVEKLNTKLEYLDKKTLLDENEVDFLNQLKGILQEINSYLSRSNLDNDSKYKIIDKIEKLNLRHQGKEQKNIIKILFEIFNSIELPKPSNKSKQLTIKKFIKPVQVNSFVFKFAFKMSVSVSFIILLSEIFNITYGRWIVFPLIAIIQPKIEGSLKKSFERVLGTIIGISLFVVIFSVIKDNSIRLNITIILAYVNLFVRQYYISTSLVAVSALGSTVMAGGGGEILFLRIAFTSLGCILGLLVNRYAFYYDLDKYNNELMKEYDGYIYKVQSDEFNKLDMYDIILKSELLKYRMIKSRK